MKRLLSIFCLSAIAFCAFGITHTYTPSSVLGSGSWVKIRVSESGVYRMTYEELQAAGLGNPSDVRVYGYGGAMLTQNFNKAKIDDLPAVGFYMEKGADGVFGAGDYILFYAQGTTSWAYNGTQFIHTRNPYSDYGYYFLTDNGGTQNLLPTANAIDGSGGTAADTYTNYQIHEQDLLNLLDRESGVDGGGREFYGESFSSTTPNRTFSFTTPDVVVSAPVRIRSEVAAASSSSSRFTLGLNGGSNTLRLDSIPVSDFYTKGALAVFNKDYTANGNTHHVVLSFSNSASGAAGYLNYIELSATCRLSMTGSYMPFRTPVNYGSPTPVVYSLTNATAQTQIWNITDRAHITRVPATLSGNTLTFVGINETAVQEYVAVNTNGTGWLTPDIVGSIDNQNLHRLKNIDYVIICPAEYVGEATRLAQAHARKQAITWAVATDQQV